MTLPAVLIVWLCPPVAALLCARMAAHYFQLESYQLGGYFRTLQRNGVRAFGAGLAVTAAALLFSFFLPAFISALLMLALACVLYCLARRIPARKPFVRTPRVLRLIACLYALLLLATTFLFMGLKPPHDAAGFRSLCCLPVLSPLFLALAAIVILPLEKGIQALYRQDAMRRLDSMPDLIKIGVTGSYGKTSAKFMLETILKEKYNVLATRESFNTSMGVTRVIREDLTPAHQVFIAEMGSRHPGDIALLCKIVRPQYGIITSVGPQHLETFHTQDAVTREKNVLAQAIPQDGAMVFYADGGICERLYEQCACPKYLAGRDLRAEHVEVGAWGSRFTLTDGKDEIACETRVLGAHNIGNLLIACTMARVLGLDLQTIARGVAKVKPVAHRLELLQTSNGVIVIDDAFNANPVGASAALEALSKMPGRRVVITPGFVEMGEREAEFNRELGRQIAAFADAAVLVGKRHTAPIAEGLREAGFDENAIHIENNLDGASSHIRAGDAVLFENDLPDNYKE